MDATLASNNTNTVSFDVGGTIYRVSQSLLDQHPNTVLARMASDTWRPQQQQQQQQQQQGVGGSISQDNASEPLFMERDSERFRYVLDFMRDGGNVHLPHNIPKEAFLQDLVYFGFANVDPFQIVVATSLPMYKACKDQVDSFLKQLKVTGDLTRVAHRLVSNYREDFKRHHTFRYESNAEIYDYCQSHVEELNAILQPIGLKATVVHHKLFSDITIKLEHL